MTDKKQISEGILIGRAFNKLQAIVDAEQVELTQSPGQIRDKYAARRHKVMAELPAGIRDKVQKLFDDEEEAPDSE